MRKKILYVGLDVHKCSIDMAIAGSEANRPVRSYGQIDNRLGILDRVIGKLQSKESELRFVYEAGPCGYQIYRHLTAKGYDCTVVAPSRIPKKRGDRIKNDRRDACTLARLDRASRGARATADLTTGEEIIALLKSLSQERGVTVISATHDFKMLNVSDQVVCVIHNAIVGGEIVPGNITT